MKKILLIISSIAILQLSAQDSFAPLLQSIEQNNTTLRALREQTNATKIENRTGINMVNPEVEYGRQWGDKNAESNKHELSVTQSFDFPTAYRYKKQLAGELDKQADLEYELQRREVLLEARNLCVELTYQSEVNRVLTERAGYARELAEAYERLFGKGEIDIIERNRTKLALLNQQKALEMNVVEINTLKKELQRLNGGMAVDRISLSYPSYGLPLDFDAWFSMACENNPAILIGRQQIEASRKQEQLRRSLNLPKFTAGYVNAYEGGGHFNGFTVGMSIPLWEGKNTVKAQKAQTQALQYRYEDNGVQFCNTVFAQYDRAGRLLVLLVEYRETLDNSNNRELLQKAFDKGQMSLIAFLQELAAYYETEDQYMQVQRDYQLAIALLQQWEK